MVIYVQRQYSSTDLIRYCLSHIWHQMDHSSTKYKTDLKEKLGLEQSKCSMLNRCAVIRLIRHIKTHSLIFPPGGFKE